MERRWNILTANTKSVKELQESLKISPAICKILVQRGIDSFDKARQYFRPELSLLHDPYLMKDMDKAVARIIQAIEKKEKILVYGDYDVDGTTSVACFYRFLKTIYFSKYISFYIPHRYREGYGVSKIGIDFAKENSFSLIISLDCGIKSVELIQYARDLGIDFIVCDHHLPDKVLPNAHAILNPKQKGCGYPYKELCGCGVGFKLITALCLHLGLPEDHFLRYLDLVVTAIGADIVPLTGENRILAFYGLQKLNSDPQPGIRALMELSGLKKKFSLNNVVFTIAPRINAAGRMDEATKAVELFIEDDYEKAKKYAALLHQDNSDRKEADSSITQEALAIISRDESLIKRKTTVVFQPHWHKGVVGIVASRLIESYFRPTVVLAQHGDIIGGSARSVPGFNLYEAIHSCREYLLGYGGHFAAAGLTLDPENMEAFNRKFEEVVSSTIDPALLVPEITIDSTLEFEDITAGFYNILNQMEPFGPENLRPVFITRNASTTAWTKIVKNDHIRFVLKKGDKVLSGIGFNMANKFSLLETSRPVDIVYSLEENEWNGQTSIQFKMIDFSTTAPPYNPPSP